jgi:hypothetical protein
MRIESYDDIDGGKVYRLSINRNDFILSRCYDPMDLLLLQECEQSNKVSDKLLALEMIARHIEEGYETHA